MPLLERGFIAERVEAFLGWIPCLHLAQVNRSFPSTATRLRLTAVLHRFDLPVDNAFGQDVHRIYEHFIRPLRARQNCALTAAPADYPPNAAPMQQVRVRYLRNQDWTVLPLEPVPVRRLTKVFGCHGFQEAIRALTSWGNTFRWGRVKSEWVTNRRFVRLTGIEVTRLQAVVQGFEVELKMIRKWQLDEGDPRLHSDEESESSSSQEA